MVNVRQNSGTINSFGAHWWSLQVLEDIVSVVYVVWNGFEKGPHTRPCPRGMEPYGDESGGRGISGGANPWCLAQLVMSPPEPLN
jgi:hypothetical protein